MLIELTHTTELRYDEPVLQSQMELRVCPAQLADQVRLSFQLAIGPATQVHGYFDWLDNHVHAFGINGRHDRIRIEATSIVQTGRPDLSLDDVRGFPDTWPLHDRADLDYALFDFVTLGGPVAESVALRTLADDVKPRDGETLGEVVVRAMQLVNGRFEYEKGVTTSATPVAEFLRQGKGVCQDFTHAYLGVLRSLGVPARYASGIVHDGRDDQMGTPGGRFLGASQTHAWVEVYVPSRLNEPCAGWVGIDPTNACVAGGHFVKVAVGRHFGDVPPNRGVLLGGGGEKIDVGVKTRRLDQLPPELTAERFTAIGVAAVPEPVQVVAGDGQQQQQQQQ